MDEWTVTEGQRHRLEQQLRRTADARVYRRTLALLEVSQGIPIAEVARTLGVSRQSVYNWLENYGRTHDPAALQEAVHPGRPKLWTTDLELLLHSLMTMSPDQRGYFATNWTVPLLQEELKHCGGAQVSDDTIRRELSRLGYVWKRSRYVLQPDPEEEKKTPHSPANPGLAAAECVVGGR
jgi:transposase